MFFSTEMFLYQVKLKSPSPGLLNELKVLMREELKRHKINRTPENNSPNYCPDQKRPRPDLSPATT